MDGVDVGSLADADVHLPGTSTGGEHGYDIGAVGDLDGDSHEDIFLSQNFFATALDYTRLDAGRGLVLRGDGHGGLMPVPGQTSGIEVYGEQRGCALADFDGDGRKDLLLATSAGPRLLSGTAGEGGFRDESDLLPAQPAWNLTCAVWVDEPGRSARISPIPESVPA